MFEEASKQIKIQWKIQKEPKAADGKNQAVKGVCVPYIDARDVQKVLDLTVWPMKWKTEFKVINIAKVKTNTKEFEKYTVECTLSIQNENFEWISKTDVWVWSEREAEKSAYSDALKRAGYQWWICRNVYDYHSHWITKEEYEKNKYNLTDYINSRLSQSNQQYY